MKLYYNKFKGGSDYKQLDFRAAPVSNFRTNQFSEKKQNSLAVAGKLATGKEKTINHSIPFADPGW